MAIIKHILLGMAVCSVLASCQKEGIGSQRSKTVICLNAMIKDNSTIEGTKSAYSGTFFEKGKTMGFSVCVHEDSPVPSLFEPHMQGYGNMKVTCTNSTGNEWSFFNQVINAELPCLYLTTRTDLATADIYAYTPFIEDVTDFCVIPVNFSNNMDLMWAMQNGQYNRGIDPSINDTIRVPLTFEHLLSRIRVGLKLEYAGSNHLIDYITIRKSGDELTTLYSGGIFNALNGSTHFPTLYEAEDSVMVKFGEVRTDLPYYIERNGLFSSATAYTYFDYLIYPTDYIADDDFTLVISIDGFPHEYSIKKSDVLHNDGVTYGFKQGYSYDFHFLFDNYVHIKDITIKDEWTPSNLSGVI